MSYTGLPLGGDYWADAVFAPQQVFPQAEAPVTNGFLVAPTPVTWSPVGVASLALSRVAYRNNVSMLASSALAITALPAVQIRFGASSTFKVNTVSLNGTAFVGTSTLTPGDKLWTQTPPTAIPTAVAKSFPFKATLYTISQEVNISMATMFAIGAGPYGIVAGDTVNIPVQVLTGGNTSAARTPVNVTGASFTYALSLERSPATFDTSAVVTKTVGNGITVTAPTSGNININLTAPDTSKLNGVYYHQLTMTDSAGNVSTLFYGTINIRPSLI